MKYIFILLALLGSFLSASSASALVNNVGPGGIPPGPQCFPWVWAYDYFELNISSMYENQRICREERLKTYGY